jgi:hypothetical protein
MGFKCSTINGKISTFIIEFTKNNEKIEWMFVMGNSKIMSEWVNLINEVLVSQGNNTI